MKRRREAPARCLRATTTTTRSLYCVDRPEVETTRVHVARVGAEPVRDDAEVVLRFEPVRALHDLDARGRHARARDRGEAGDRLAVERDVAAFGGGDVDEVRDVRLGHEDIVRAAELFG